RRSKHRTPTCVRRRALRPFAQTCWHAKKIFGGGSNCWRKNFSALTQILEFKIARRRERKTNRLSGNTRMTCAEGKWKCAIKSGNCGTNLKRHKFSAASTSNTAVPSRLTRYS